MVTNMDFSTKANHGSLNWFQSSAACYTMNFYTKLAILISVSADEPSADCDYIEIGLQCQSDCEYNFLDAISLATLTVLSTQIVLEVAL